MKAKGKTVKKANKAQLQYLESNFDKESEKELSVNTGLGIRAVRQHLKTLQSKLEQTVHVPAKEVNKSEELTPEEFLQQEREKEKVKENERLGLYYIKDGSVIMTPGQSMLDDIIRQQTPTGNPRYHKNIHYMGKKDG